MSATPTRTPLRARLSRLPLRARLVAGFSAAMLVVLLGAGVFVYWRVDYALDRGLDTELAQAATTLKPLVGADGTVRSRNAADATGVAWQVLSPSGAVIDHGGPAAGDAMVSARQLARVGGAASTFEIGDMLPASPAPYRLQVSRVGTHYLMVGVRRDHRDEALRELLAQLALAGLGALVVTAFVGDRLARAALRPVERYRRRAAEIAAGAHDLRLDVPAGRDDEVTRLGHTFNAMLSTLERALDRERQFVSEASHELRTPITLLSSRLQLARRRPRSVEEHERVLDELQIDLDRLAQLAEGLLQLGTASAAAGDGAGHPDDRVEVAHVVSRVVEARMLAGTTSPTETTVELTGGDTAVAMTDLEVERILTNLLDNARVHGVAPYRIVLDLPSPDWVRLTVGDAGPGMSAELLASATQRFARADDARARPGAGLGLSLVDALVTGAGGELRLCFAGHHASHGDPAPVACDHGPEMTVTALLPVR